MDQTVGVLVGDMDVRSRLSAAREDSERRSRHAQVSTTAHPRHSRILVVDEEA